ncbi:MAG: TIGR02710 family CRISPR-associated CARF protein [Bacillota bacterium]
MAKMLICTVGGSPEPICKSILTLEPQRVYFVCSSQTQHQVEAEILPRLAAQGIQMDCGRYERVIVSDSQNFEACVESIKSHLTLPVKRWLGTPENRLYIDFTGGTKCMTAALTLVSHRWKCNYVYVGGQARTKDGLGIVIPGTEEVLLVSNPMDSMGYQVYEDIAALFNSMNYAAAAEIADRARSASNDPRVKEALTILHLLSTAYLAWDKFEHRSALHNLQKVLKRPLSLEGLLGYEDAANVLQKVRSHEEFLQALLQDETNRMKIVDLLANARRKQTELRYDDAVARYYRAIEAAAQIELNQRYGISTGNLDLAKLPTELKSRYSGKTMIGLQSAYSLLFELGNELGKRFFEMGLDGEHSPLSTRNCSILAHGFDPVGEEVCERLSSFAFTICGVSPDQLPEFPVMCLG